MRATMGVWRSHQIVRDRAARRAGAVGCKADMQGGSGSRADRVGADRGPLALLFHVPDLVDHLLARVDRRRLLRVERPAWMEVRQQHGKRVADAAELLAVGGDVGEHARLDAWIARLAEIDVDEPELAAGHECRERIDRLHDIAGQGKLEYGHARLLDSFSSPARAL